MFKYYKALKHFPQITGIIGEDDRVYWNKEDGVSSVLNPYEFKVQKFVRNYDEFADLLCKEEMSQDERDNASFIERKPLIILYNLVSYSCIGGRF
jgi:hypothetical protein